MLDTIFLVCAIVGGAMLALRTVLMLFGVGDDHPMHASVDGHGDADLGTQLLSIQGVSAFLTMFGLVGLALLRQSPVPGLVALPVALAAGFGSMWMIGRVFRLMRGLESSGNVDLAHAIGEEGVVYLTVRPPSGGQVQVTVQGRLGVFDAQAESESEIATGRRVRVVAVRGGALIVEPL
jgi:membrane protein implicated in regulation of membrane protease activity